MEGSGQPIDIGAAYDRIADLWNGDAFNRRNGIAQHERALAYAPEGGRALDVGCGCSGRLFDLLAARGFAVEGVDASARMVELARLRHPSVPIHLADIRAWPLPGAYEFITAWDSIWHLPLADHDSVLRKLLRGLAPGGVIAFSMGGLDAPEEKADDAMGPLVPYSTLGIPAAMALVAGEQCALRHFEFDQWPESHAFVVARRTAP